MSCPTSPYCDLTLNISPGLAYGPGDFLMFYCDDCNYINGKVISYNFSTGEIVISPNTFVGSGECCNWTVNLSGTPGVDGTSGTSGTSGSSGTSSAGAPVPQVQNPTVSERRNIDVYNGQFLNPNTAFFAPAAQPIFFGAGNGSIHIIAGNSSMLRSTDNGITWNAINTNIIAINTLLTISGIIYVGNDTFIAVFTGGNNQNNVIIYSNDNGITWNLSNIEDYPNTYKSKYGAFGLQMTQPVFLNVGGVLTIVVSMYASIFYSIDNGVTFITANPVTGTPPTPSRNSTLGSNVFALNTANGYFFAYPAFSTTTFFLYSTNGIDWTYSGTLPTAVNITSIDFNNGRYFINQTTNNSTIYTTNFTSFTTVARTTVVATMAQASQAYNGDTIISVGNDFLRSVNNGNTWTSLFNDSGLTVFSGLINLYASTYAWFDGTRFNVLASTGGGGGSVILLFDTNGTGTTWDFSPVDSIINNRPSPPSIYLISNTRYATQIRYGANLNLFKTIVRDTPSNGSTNIDICQSAIGTTLSGNQIWTAYLTQPLSVNNYFNFKYINNRFVSPTGLYFQMSNGSNPTLDWIRPAPVRGTRSTPSATALNGVHFANGFWIAFGNAGLISTSPDLINWTIATSSPTGGTLFQMENIGSIGVITDRTGNLLVSTNIGTTPFTTVALTGILTTTGFIATDGTRFVVTCGNTNSSNIAVSTNGTTWTLVSLSSFNLNTPNRIVYLNGRFIICHQFGVITSSDGITWTSPFTSANGPQMNNCVYTGTHWVACGNNCVILRSSDAINWEYVISPQLRLLSFSASFNSMASDGNGNIVLPFLSNGGVGVSDNHGKNWRMVSPGGVPFSSSGPQGPVMFGNGYFVIFASPYYYCSSDGGNTWNLFNSQNESIEFTSGGGIKKVNNKYFVYQPVTDNSAAGGGGMRVADSLTGTWSKCKTGITLGAGTINDISSDGSSYIAVTTGNKILRSTDGINFIDVSPKILSYSTISYFGFVEYANGIFIAGGVGGMLYKSTTGQYGTWVSINSAPSNQQYFGIAYGNGIWVLASFGKVLVSSDNGTTWIENRVNFTSAFSSLFLRFYNGFFYISGFARTVLYRSSDGINWKMINTDNQQINISNGNNIYALERDSSTGYLYLFGQDSIRVSTDNGLTFSRTPANPFMASQLYNSTALPYNYRQIVEGGYAYVSMSPRNSLLKSFELPFQFIGLPIS